MKRTHDRQAVSVAVRPPNVAPGKTSAGQAPVLLERRPVRPSIPVADVAEQAHAGGYVRRPTRAARRFLPIAVVVLAGGLAAPAAVASPLACPPQTTTISGATAVKFCGPASAAVAAAGRAFRFSHGSCARQGKLFFAQIGVIGGPRRGALQSLPLFYLLTDPRSPAKSTILYWILDGKRYRAAAAAHIAVTARSVSFSGRLAVGTGFSGSGAFSGRLTCS